MVVKVNATCTNRVRMNQVAMTVAIVKVLDDCDKGMSVVTELVKQITDRVNGITGVTCDVQRAGVCPHMVWKQDELDNSNKKTERVQKGHEAYAYLTIGVPFGTAELNPIAKVVADVGGALSVRYSLSDDARKLEGSALRCKLMTEAVKQCREILSMPDGSAKDGVSIIPSRVYYHSQDCDNAQFGVCKMSDRAAGSTGAEENEVSFDLDSIYTREHAPYVDISDSLEVSFDVEGYVLPE